MRLTAQAAGAAAFAPSLVGLTARSLGGVAVSAASQGGIDYGPLVSAGPELDLPEGFTYTVLSANGQPMTNGAPTPGAFDGMAAFAMPDGRIRLLRNHENRDSAGDAAVKGDAARAYDRRAGGGVSTLVLDMPADGPPTLVRDFMSLNGTIVNCAGGPTPWGSWLSCEESVEGRADGWSQEHGYIFEVPAAADVEVDPVPLKAMGRFVHEAIAVDPETGFVYETEDRDTAGFYRFQPTRPGELAAGGRLQMLAVVDRPRYDTATDQPLGAALPVTWVDIDDPDPSGAAMSDLAVFNQGTALGGARFARLEGCWYGDASIYFHATNGGNAKAGQVWRYEPTAERLTLVYESPGREVLDYPDNITVSPRGGILICEDGSGDQHLRGLTPQGVLFDFAVNTLNDTEFAGACFSPDGRVLFVNIQGATSDSGSDASRTLAIMGPWERGAL